MKKALAIATAALLLLMPSAIAAAPSLSDFPPISIEFGSTNSLKLTPPTSNSSGSWSYTSSDKAIAVINGDSLIPISVGTATITATQSADSQYSSGTISTTVTIRKGNPILGAFNDQYFSFTGAKNSKVTLNPPLSNSNGAWTFTSLNPNVATVTGNIATILALGIAPITATQASTNNFNASNQLVMNLRVVGPPPTLGTWPAMSHTFSEGTFQLTPPTSQSKGNWTFTSSNASVATVIGNSVIINSVGTATISAAQEADPIYGPASTSSKLTITKSTPTVGILQPITVRANDPGVALVNPNSDSDGTWNFSTSDRKIAIIKNGQLFGLIPGTVTLTASQGEGKNYLSSQPVTTTVTVTNPALPVTLETPQDIAIFLKSGPIPYLPPKDESTGTWTITSSNLDAVRIGNTDGFTLIPVGLGTSNITITQAMAGDYAGVTKTFKVAVIPKITYSVKVTGRNIIVKTADKSTTVTIDNKAGKVGSNPVSKGKHRVRLINQGVYFDKIFVVK